MHRLAVQWSGWHNPSDGTCNCKAKESACIFIIILVYTVLLHLTTVGLGLPTNHPQFLTVSFPSPHVPSNFSWAFLIFFSQSVTIPRSVLLTSFHPSVCMCHTFPSMFICSHHPYVRSLYPSIRHFEYMSVRNVTCRYHKS